MCSLQECNYSTEFFWYVFFSLPTLFPRVGHSIPDRPKRQCLQRYLSCPAAIFSSAQFPLSYSFPFVHRPLSIKPSSVTYWSPSRRTLCPVCNTRNGGPHYWSLTQILDGEKTSETCTQSTRYSFSNPGNPPLHSCCKACRNVCARIRRTSLESILPCPGTTRPRSQCHQPPSRLIITSIDCKHATKHESTNVGMHVTHSTRARVRSCSGVGAQSAAFGPTRKCRRLVWAMMSYLWRHRAQSTMVWSFVFEDLFARTFAKFSVNCRLLILPEHHAAGRNEQLQLLTATTWSYQQSIRTGNNYYKQKTIRWTVSKLKKDYKATTN